MTLDQLLSFSFKDSHIRGVIAQSHESYDQLVGDIDQRDHYPLFIQQLLGEMSIALCMMSSNLKLAGKLSLQIRGNAYLKDAFVEVTLPQDMSEEEDLSTPPSAFFIRGIARFNHDFEKPDAIDLTQWVGDKATLAITMLPDQGQRYQGITSIDHPRFMQCLEDYYLNSEQIQTKFWFQSSEKGVAGFMLQQLPEASALKAKPLMDWPTALTLSQTIRPNELLDDEPMDLVYKLFHEQPPLLHQQRRIEFRCSCSRSRFQQGLVSLDLEEIKSMAEEQESIEVHCNLCGKPYEFNTQELLLSHPKNKS